MSLIELESITEIIFFISINIMLINIKKFYYCSIIILKKFINEINFNI